MIDTMAMANKNTYPISLLYIFEPPYNSHHVPDEDSQSAGDNPYLAGERCIP